MYGFSEKSGAELADAVNAYKKGSTEAFDCIYEYSFHTLKKYALYLSRDEYEAEDLIQDTYLKIISNIGSMRENMAFMIWARTIMYNQFINRCRKNEHEFCCDDEVLNAFQDKESASCADDPEAVMVRNEQLQEVDSLVRDLPEKQKDAVVRFYYGMVPIGHIAKYEKTNVGTIKTRLFYARKSLRSAFDGIHAHQ